MKYIMFTEKVSLLNRMENMPLDISEYDIVFAPVMVYGITRIYKPINKRVLNMLRVMYYDFKNKLADYNVTFINKIVSFDTPVNYDEEFTDQAIRVNRMSFNTFTDIVMYMIYTDDIENRLYIGGDKYIISLVTDRTYEVLSPLTVSLIKDEISRIEIEDRSLENKGEEEYIIRIPKMNAYYISNKDKYTIMITLYKESFNLAFGLFDESFDPKKFHEVERIATTDNFSTYIYNLCLLFTVIYYKHITYHPDDDNRCPGLLYPSRLTDEIYYYILPHIDTVLDSGLDIVDSLVVW